MKGLDIALRIAGATAAICVAACEPPKSRADQIMDQCREEFGDEGNVQVNDCAIKVMMDELAKRERDKLERAAR